MIYHTKQPSASFTSETSSEPDLYSYHKVSIFYLFVQHLMVKMQNKGNFRVAQLLEFSEHIQSSKTVWLHKMSKAVTINIYLQSLNIVSWKTDYCFLDPRIHNLPHYLQHWVYHDLKLHLHLLCKSWFLSCYILHFWCMNQHSKLSIP